MREFCATWQMFHFWFHTAFVDSNYLVFDRDSLDGANKVRFVSPHISQDTKSFKAWFRCEIFLQRVDTPADAFSVYVATQALRYRAQDKAEAEEEDEPEAAKAK